MSFTLSFNTKGDLSSLNAFLQSRSYVIGFSATETDIALHKAIGGAPDAAKYPNVFRYYSHISTFAGKSLPAGVASSSGAAPAASASAPAPASKAAPKAPVAAKDDDEVDLFGDDGDAAAAKVASAKVEEPKKEEKKVKAKPIAKTICTYDVKPMDSEVSVKAIEAAVRAIKMDGLAWGQEFKVVDVAFGIQKLMIQFVCEDEKVSLDDVEEQILALPNLEKADAEDPDERLLVQSIDQLSMNKLG